MITYRAIELRGNSGEIYYSLTGETRGPFVSYQDAQNDIDEALGRVTGPMREYRVRLVQTIIEETWATVHADSVEAAESAAIARAMGNDDDEPALDWDFVECIGDIEAVHVELEN